jgi:hypothetical protein
MPVLMRSNQTEKSMKTHTLGKWEASGCTIYSGDTIVAVMYCEGNRSLHNLHENETPPDSMGKNQHGKGWEEAWANARLTASAPELLDACKAALAIFKKQFPLEHGNPELGSAWGMLEGAIFKAEGRDA